MAGKRGVFATGCLTGLSLVVVIAALVVGAIFVFQDQLVEMRAKQLAPPAIAHGREANWNWNVSDLDGVPVSMSEFSGRPVFLHFWSPSCLACLTEMPGVANLMDRAPDAVAFVLVAVAGGDEAAATAAKYGIERGLYQFSGVRPEPFNEPAVPATCIVARDGSLVLMHRGAARWDDESVLDLLVRLAAELEPEPEAEPALHDESPEIVE